MELLVRIAFKSFDLFGLLLMVALSVIAVSGLVLAIG